MFNILKKITLLSLLCIAIFSVVNSFVFAQIPSSSLSDQSNSIDMSISPANPRSGDTIILELSSYGIDLDTAKITWYIDGVATKEGAGQKTLTIQAKNSGDTTVIRTVVETADGVSVETTKQVSPSGVDIVIEPTSFVPAFYQGKPLFINQGIARVVAIPDVMISGKKASSKNLVFRWQRDDTFLQSLSGIGKDSVIITGTVPIRDITVSVQITDSSGNIIAANSKVIVANSPEILFYENSPLYGILFNKAITNSYYLGDREELKIVAKPYFFNVKTDDSTDLGYAWSVNGNPVATEGKTNELILRQTGTNLKGTASISLDVNNLIKIFQYTTAGFNITFGQ